MTGTISSEEMLSESVVCLPRGGCPYHTTAKRYWLPEFEANRADPDALTLILLHSTSFHKETWEPTLKRIFQQDSGVKLREAWALDCPNHGEAAKYNEDVLRQDEHRGFTCQKYAHAVYCFLTAEANEGAQIDFRRRRLVGIGHSLGANTMLLIQEYEQLPFLSLIIIEPMVSPEGSQHLEDLKNKLIKSAKKREWGWNSREEARIHFMEKSKWDRRVIDLYVDYGLRADPAANAPQDRVVLACTPEQEIAMYNDEEGSTKPVEVLNKICKTFPIHLILGKKPDLIPATVHQALVDPRSGRCYASTEYIKGAGHLLPQKKPDELGFVISAALVNVQTKSRL
ncbi:hypothetical protein AX15_007015 [Amanita polypyramis BW_CC]|nr:hypothetical protein AX15_007015 [Amanita polypyramis BW_CC]